MLIRKDSWHLRFNDWLYTKVDRKDPRKHKSLCQYFWYTVRGILTLPFIPIIYLLTTKIPFIPKSSAIAEYEIRGFRSKPAAASGELFVMSFFAVLVGVVLGMVAFTALNMIFYLIMGFNFLNKFTLDIGMAFTVIVLGLVFVIYMEKIFGFFSGLIAPLYDDSGLLFNYLKAVKDKACPMVRFEDEVEAEE